MDVGERFGPYHVGERLGAGGMATVHRATIAIGGGVVREVALKRLLPQLVNDQGFVEDFVREAKLAARLTHPNIVKILELGQIDGTYFIAMELVAGQSLLKLMQRAYAAKRPAPIGVVLALIGELCDALEYATNGADLVGERFQIVHRDLSPSNLIVTTDGHLKVIDFGVAKATSGKFMTSSGLVKGKLGYMSFESVSGKTLDARSDIFSTGVVAWELLTGRRLFKGINEYEVICRIREGIVPAPSTLNERCPTELDACVLCALAKDREDRFVSGRAMRGALDEVRRYYRDGSTARDVTQWVAELAIATERARTTPAHGVAEDEPTMPRMPAGSSRDARPKFITSDTIVDTQAPTTVPETTTLELADDDVS